MVSAEYAQRYCRDDISLIQNYELAIADKTQVWCIHHKLEVQGQFVNSVELLKKCKMYWKRPASELVFLTKAEHNAVHFKGKCQTEELKRKRGLARRGTKYTAEQRMKISKALAGRHWFNNGERQIRVYVCPGREWKPGKLIGVR